MIERSWMRRLDSLFDNRKSKTCPESYRRIQNPKWAGLFVIVVALTVCGARVQAQQSSKIPKIVVFSLAPPDHSLQIGSNHSSKVFTVLATLKERMSS
jgi:hypothetical protein